MEDRRTACRGYCLADRDDVSGPLWRDRTRGSADPCARTSRRRRAGVRARHRQSDRGIVERVSLATRAPRRVDLERGERARWRTAGSSRRDTAGAARSWVRCTLWTRARGWPSPVRRGELVRLPRLASNGTGASSGPEFGTSDRMPRSCRYRRRGRARRTRDRDTRRDRPRRSRTGSRRGSSTRCAGASSRHGPSGTT